MSNYYQTEDLARLSDVAAGAPALWEKFQAWYADVFQDGDLTAREKALMGLAVSNALQCPYCIDVYTRSSLDHGASIGQMTEAVQVAAAIRAGTTLSHGIQMREIADKRTA